MRRVAMATLMLVISSAAAPVSGQAPSYSKDIRPFLAKYCLECHTAKAMKGSLSLETFKAMMDGSDGGAVVTAGKPDDSRLVLLIEHKDKPAMPPPKAKFQPTKAEVAAVRAWIQDGAKDDAATVNVELPDIKAKLDLLAPVVGIGYLPKTRELVIARTKQLTIADLDNGTAKIWTPKSKGRITALAISPRTGNYIIGTRTGHTEMPVLVPGVHLPIRGDHDDSVLELLFDPDGILVATASYDTKIIVGYRNAVGTVPPVFHELKEHSDAVYGLAFSPDGKLLASVSADRAMKVFDVEHGKLLYTLGHATDWLYCVAWSPDGKYLVSGGVDKSIRVYEAKSTLTPGPSLTGRGEWNAGAKLRQSVFAHEGAVLKLVFSSDSRTLYSVGEDRIVKAWDIEKMVERKVYAKQPETVLCLALREDAQQIIVGRYDGIVQLIEMRTGKVAHEFGKPAPKPRDKRSDSRGSNAGETPLHPQETLRSSWGVVRHLDMDSPATGQPIALPANLTGTLDRAGAVHVYRFDAKKGQPLGIQLVTGEFKSKVDPVLTLTDLTGHILAESYEGHLGFTFPDSGTYAIGVRDRDYRGGDEFKYRLHMGEIPVVTAVFPMGMRRGTKGDIQLDGVFLAKKVIPFSVPADANVGQTIPLSVGAGVLGKAQMVVGEFPEVMEAGKIPVPGTANGRIARDNQKDVWSFHAQQGERLIVEVNARRIGSRLDSIIEILDKNDQPVPRAVLRSQAKTCVTFRDHDSAQANIRIETWSELGTNDYLYVGNELMKIKELPTHPDADCNFFAADGKRLTYLDTTPTHHANNTPMYKVSVHPPGTIFPPNGYPVFTLYYRNDDGGPGYGRDSRILFDPPADGDYKLRIADARGMGGDIFGYRLTVRPPKPDCKVRLAPANPVVSKGSAIPLTLTAERIDGYAGPIHVRFLDQPPGWHIPDTTIEAGAYTAAVAIYAEPNVKISGKEPPLRMFVTQSGREKAGEYVPFNLPKLIEPGDIVTTTAESEVTIKPGQQTKLVVKIERHNGFAGRVPLDVKGLPHGVRVLDIGLNGILVNENETTRTIVLYAEPWVQPAERPFVVLARREGKNTEHAAKSVILRVN